MKTSDFFNRKGIFALGVITCIASAGALASCAGRTPKNMIPTGDTVEVIVNQTADVDSAVSADTTQISLTE